VFILKKIFDKKLASLHKILKNFRLGGLVFLILILAYEVLFETKNKWFFHSLKMTITTQNLKNRYHYPSTVEQKERSNL
jgi:hypothetical protein